MNAVAAKRSLRINMLVKHGVEFDCTYDGQINTHMGRLLSVMFNGDHMADHAFFLMLLNKEWTTADTFLDFFYNNLELMEYMIDYYMCEQLKSEISATRRKHTVNNFLKSRLLSL